MNCENPSSKAAPRQGAPAKDRRVLVMDDEELIRVLAASMIRFLGYQVQTCAHGAEAIAKYRSSMESGKPYLTVIMDLKVNGGMGGEEAARHILDIDPGARLIVSSGYSDEPVMADFRRFGFYAVLKKPYTVFDLDAVLSLLSL